jgi:hypothetical protein
MKGDIVHRSNGHIWMDQGDGTILCDVCNHKPVRNYSNGQCTGVLLPRHDPNFTYDKTKWAQAAASRVMKYADEAAIDTANYMEMSFAIAAAELAISNPEFAKAIGEKMESPRHFHDLPEDK